MWRGADPSFGQHLCLEKILVCRGKVTKEVAIYKLLKLLPLITSSKPLFLKWAYREFSCDQQLPKRVFCFYISPCACCFLSNGLQKLFPSSSSGHEVGCCVASLSALFFLVFPMRQFLGICLVWRSSGWVCLVE